MNIIIQLILAAAIIYEGLLIARLNTIIPDLSDRVSVHATVLKNHSDTLREIRIKNESKSSTK